jgi:hypothetical protein
MPSFGATNDLIVSHVLETTMGVTPANPVMNRLRVNGETLGPNVTFDETDEINPNYDLTDLILTGSSAGGSIPFDFAKSAAFDMVLEAVLRGTWTAGVLKAGIVRRSYSLEKSFLAGGSRKYMKFLGLRYGGITLTGSVGGKTTGTIDAMALSAIPGTTSIVGTGSVTEPAETRILSMVDVTVFTITGDTLPLIMTGFTLGIQNNLRMNQGHGQVAGYDIQYGMREVTFTFDAYFESWEQMDKMLNRTNSNVSMTITDGTNTYLVRLPKLRYRNVTADAEGNNADMMQTIEGRGLIDATLATSLQITRTPAA